MSATLTQTQISSLYVTIFNRASEGEGNQFWQSLNKPIADTATAMLNSTASRDYFGTNWDSDQLFIEHIYKNTLNKTVAEDSEGITFWVTRLATESRGEVVDALIKAISGDFTGNAKALEAQNQFNNRVEVSNHMADTIFETPDNYVQVTGFNGDLTVTSDTATVTSANETIDNMTHVVGETIVVAGGGLFNGTNNDDTFLVSKGEIDNAIIKAKGGDDILKATITEADDDKAALTTYDLETILLRNTNGNTTIDLLEANGLKEVWNDRSSDSANLTLDGVSTDVTVGIKKTNTSTTVKYENISGTDDTVAVKLDGSEKGASLGVAGIETLNLEVASDSHLNISGNSGLKNIAVTSTSALNLTVDGTSTMSIAGGEGEDTIFFSSGDGSNLTLTNIENLAVSSGSTMDLDKFNVDKIISQGGTLTTTNVEKETFVITGATPILEATLKDATGTADAISVEVLKSDTTNAALTLNNIEVLNIETNNELNDDNVKVNLTTSTTGTANQTLNISGDGVAEFMTTAVYANTIDASTNTAGVILSLGATDQAITGTAKDDSFDFKTHATATDTVDGGAGDDVVKFTTTATSVSATTSNIETAEVAFGAASHTFDAGNLNGVSSIKLSGIDTSTVSNILADTFIEIDGAVGTSLTLGLKTATGATDNLDIIIDGTQAFDKIIAQDIESLSFTDTTDNGNTTITALDATSLTKLDFSDIDGALTVGSLNNSANMNLILGGQNSTSTAVSLTLAATGITDTISFGSLIGDVTITNFTAGNGSAGDDIIDLSDYGVTAFNQLTISDDGTNTTIDIAEDTSFGSIKLMGVADSDAVTLGNFDFA